MDREGKSGNEIEKGRTRRVIERERKEERERMNERIRRRLIIGIL